jgi:hypothetical protein
MLSAIIGSLISISSWAVTHKPGPVIDPLSVTCILRERQFFTEILFSLNSNNQLVGEMVHYVSVGEHGRRFLNGSIFFDVTSDEKEIRGNTGDPRGIVNPFVLKPANPTNLNGRWHYIQTDSPRETTRVIFRCAYPEA